MVSMLTRDSIEHVSVEFSVDLSAWNPQLHPRDSHGRFRDKWGLVGGAKKIIDQILKRFHALTARDDDHFQEYADRQAAKVKKTPEQAASLGYMTTERGWDDIQSTLRAGKDDLPHVRNFDGIKRPLENDVILTRVTGPDAFGLPPERMGEIEEWTGKLVSDKGYASTNLGTPYQTDGPHVTWSILTPRGTQAVIPGGSREVILDREQPIRIMKVEADGHGGVNVYGVVEPMRATGRGPARNLGAPLPAREHAPHTPATPEEMAKRGLDPNGNPLPQAAPQPQVAAPPAPAAATAPDRPLTARAPETPPSGNDRAHHEAHAKAAEDRMAADVAAGRQPSKVDMQRSTHHRALAKLAPKEEKKPEPEKTPEAPKAEVPKPTRPVKTESEIKADEKADALTRRMEELKKAREEGRKPELARAEAKPKAPEPDAKAEEMDARIQARAAEKKPEPPKQPKTPEVSPHENLRTKARVRHQEIATRKPVADAAAELDELIDKKATNASMAEHVRDHAGHVEEIRDPVKRAQITRELEEIAHDLDKGRRSAAIKKMRKLEEKYHINREGNVGDEVNFDPEKHESSGGIDIPEGTRVRIVRGGTSTSHTEDNSRTRLDKPLVRLIHPKEEKKAPVKRALPAKSRLTPSQQSTLDSLTDAHGRLLKETGGADSGGWVNPADVGSTRTLESLRARGLVESIEVPGPRGRPVKLYRPAGAKPGVGELPGEVKRADLPASRRADRVAASKALHSPADRERRIANDKSFQERQTAAREREDAIRAKELAAADEKNKKTYGAWLDEAGVKDEDLTPVERTLLNLTVEGIESKKLSRPEAARRLAASSSPRLKSLAPVVGKRPTAVKAAKKAVPAAPAERSAEDVARLRAGRGKLPTPDQAERRAVFARARAALKERGIDNPNIDDVLFEVRQQQEADRLSARLEKMKETAAKVKAREAVIPNGDLKKIKVPEIRTMAKANDIPIKDENGKFRPVADLREELDGIRAKKAFAPLVRGGHREAGRDEFDAKVKSAAQGEDAVRAATPLDFESKEFRDTVGAEDYQSVQWYRGIMHGNLSSVLRSGDEKQIADHKQIQGIDRAMEHSPLKSDVVVYRGNKTGKSIFGDKRDGNLTGFEWTEPSYTSTAADERLAQGYAGEGGVVMRIVAPKGTHGLTLSRGESELALERGLRYRVVADHGFQGEGKLRHRRLDVEVVQPPKVAPAKAVRAAAPKAAKKVEGDAALDVPPIQTITRNVDDNDPLSDFHMEIKNPPKGWSPAKAKKVAKAMDDYNTESGDGSPWGVRENPGSESARLIDEAMDESVLPAPVKVYRGIARPHKIPQLEEVLGKESAVGSVIDDPGFMSTSTDADIAEGYARSGHAASPSNPLGVMLHIDAPAGMKAVRFGGFEDDDPNKELLFERGTRLTVTGDRTVNGIRTLDVTMSRGEHPTRAAEAAKAVAKAQETPTVRNLSKLTVPQLKEELKRRGMLLPPRATKPHLLEILEGSGPDGKHHVTETPDITRLREMHERKPKVTKYFSNGRVARVGLVRDENGNEAILKSHAQEGWNRSPEEMADAENLSSRVGAAVGARVPATYQPSPREVLMDRVSGRTAYKLTDEELDRHVRSPEGARMAVLDAVLGNQERHRENWMINDEGHPVGIDHGFAFFDQHAQRKDGTWPPTRGHVQDPFSTHWLLKGNQWKDKIQISKRSLERMRARLVRLRPEFVAKGREDWYNGALGRLDEIIKRAVLP